MKIRIGNDIDMLLAFKENGQSVDLTTVSNINISIILNNGDCISTTTTQLGTSPDSINYDYNFFNYSANYSISVSGIDVYFPATEQLYLGWYNLFVEFDQPSPTDKSVTKHCTTDADNVFELVKNTKDSDDAGNMTVSFNGENNAFTYTFTLNLS